MIVVCVSAVAVTVVVEMSVVLMVVVLRDVDVLFD